MDKVKKCIPFKNLVTFCRLAKLLTCTIISYFKKRLRKCYSEACYMVLPIVNDLMMMDPRCYYNLGSGHHHRYNDPSVACTLFNSWVNCELVNLSCSVAGRWLRRGSNPQPLDCEACSLLLSHSSTIQFLILILLLGELNSNRLQTAFIVKPVARFICVISNYTSG